MALCPTVSDKQTAMMGCSRVVHFSVFFDGTGNNRYDELAKDESERALSNVAKLFDAHKDGAEMVAKYIPGVGTPYPDIGDPGGSLGLALGTGADQRIRMAQAMLDEEIDKVPAQQTIRLINVVVFGFSRGAAQARAFLRDLAGQSRQEDGAYTYRGIPLRLAFAGLFDTVCSAYDNWRSAIVSRNGGHNGWAHDVKLPPMVEHSVHLMAAHEARLRFPLDSTRIGASYPDNTVEIWYPGVHADVGGGYAPQFQGRENTVSRFALNEMFDVAFTAGVLFKPIAKLDPQVQDEFRKDDPALRDAFNAYLAAVPVPCGPMETVQAAHMGLLHRWLKQRVAGRGRSASAERLLAQRAGKQQAYVEAHAHRRALLAEAGATGPNDPRLSPARRQALLQADEDYMTNRQAYLALDDALDDLAEEDAKVLRDIEALREKAATGARLNLRERTLLAAWDDPRPLPAAVRTFFDLFAHDSIAHFDLDPSRLTDWRTVYFGDAKYKPS